MPQGVENRRRTDQIVRGITIRVAPVVLDRGPVNSDVDQRRGVDGGHGRLDRARIGQERMRPELLHDLRIDESARPDGLDPRGVMALIDNNEPGNSRFDRLLVDDVGRGQTVLRPRPGRFSTLTANAGRWETWPPGAGCPVRGHVATGRTVVVVAARVVAVLAVLVGRAPVVGGAVSLAG